MISVECDAILTSTQLIKYYHVSQISWFLFSSFEPNLSSNQISSFSKFQKTGWLNMFIYSLVNRNNYHLNAYQRYEMYAYINLCVCVFIFEFEWKPSICCIYHWKSSLLNWLKWWGWIWPLCSVRCLFSTELIIGWFWQFNRCKRFEFTMNISMNG